MHGVSWPEKLEFQTEVAFDLVELTILFLFMVYLSKMHQRYFSCCDLTTKFSEYRNAVIFALNVNKPQKTADSGADIQILNINTE